MIDKLKKQQDKLTFFRKTYAAWESVARKLLMK